LIEILTVVSLQNDINSNDPSSKRIRRNLNALRNLNAFAYAESHTPFVEVVVIGLDAWFFEDSVLGVRQVGTGSRIGLAFSEDERVGIAGPYDIIDVMQLGGVHKTVGIEGVHGERGCCCSSLYKGCKEQEGDEPEKNAG
jgi:hypothetical protein